MTKAPARKRRGPPPGKGGRPPLPESELKIDVGVRMTRAELEAIDSIAGGATRSTVIRQLLAEALAARKRRAK